MKAIISDIHANLEALHAVLEDMERFNIEDVYCLGDIVGYGPNPRECVGLAMEWDVCLLGNFDQAVLFNPPTLGPTANAANSSLWMSQREIADDPYFEFLAFLPKSYKEQDVLFVHGSPRNPLNEYVFPEDVENQKKMDAIFALIDRCCFVGHTHIPGIFTDDCKFKAADEVGYRLDGRKTLCNVGSVGQPRDGDWRACYAVFDGEVIRFRRVEYDVEATVRKIEQIAELDNFLGERLRQGR